MSRLLLALLVVASFATAASDNEGQRRLLSFLPQLSPKAAKEENRATLLTNPFLSEECKNSFEDGVFRPQPSSAAMTVGVVIPVRNEAKAVLLHTISSVLANSGGPLLKRIVIVDDKSDEIVADWPEWRSNTAFAAAVQVVRPKQRSGVAGAKDYGARLLHSEVDLLVFLDAHVVVSDKWLEPLVHTLDAYPNALVYPVVDIIDPETGSFAKGENVVGAFSWAMDFKWEPLNGPGGTGSQNSRLSPLISGKGPDDVVTSPAAPGMLAVKSSYYISLGGFDVSLTPWGQESIEMSIRVWLCGGIVIRQPCSRVAHRYDNLFRKAVVSPGNRVTQASVDLNVMSIAERWMKPAYRELVYAARFTGRIPYTVQLDLDVNQPQRFNLAQPLGEAGCTNFDWYLKEIYPGLIADMAGVEDGFKVHLESDYLRRLLEPWTKMYLPPSSSDAALKPIDAHTEELLMQRANSPEEKARAQVHDSLVPKAIYGPQKPGQKRGLAKRGEVTIEKSEEKDPHERHANFIRETLLCEDEKDIPHSQPCDKLVESSSGCVQNRYYMMFGCPKACGLCGTDGKICFDFYEHKCPEYKKDGRCEQEDEMEQMKHDCRKSCGHCTPAAPLLPAVDAVKDAQAQQQPLQLNPPGAELPPLMGLPPGSGAVAVSVPVPGLNHRFAQEQYASGTLPDIPGRSPCELNGLPHGKLLARIPIAAPVTAPDVRIFCGLYTMEKNHATNVRAVKETWGKRCDGFVAFSTASDASIPAYKIEHEGDEAYDNMWQKSRSIWKFIAAHFAADFDYFLLGGDDMYYIIENLKAYLDSKEIRALRDKGEGVFLGRRFFPPKQNVFNSGGAGYTLDRKALLVLGAHLDSPECYPHQRGFWEDVNIANCLRQNGNILPYDTRDPLERERFHPFTPGQHLDYRIPPGPGDWYPKYNPFLKEGFECCSLESISFHYVPGELLRKLADYHYHCTHKT